MTDAQALKIVGSPFILPSPDVLDAQAPLLVGAPFILQSPDSTVAQTPVLVGTPFVLPDPGATAPTAMGYAVDGSHGVQTIVGAADLNVISTAMAAGTGAVVVRLPVQGGSGTVGTVTRGGKLDAFLSNIQGVQLGSEDATIYGNAAVTGTEVIYGGTGHLEFHAAGPVDAVIHGGTGSNYILGDASSSGPIGSTLFYGQGGTDVMVAGRGINTMVAGSSPTSSDTFVGLPSAQVTGASTLETDYIYARGGAVTDIGGVGSQTLFGGAGTNTMIGATTPFTDAGGVTSSGINIFHGGSGPDAGTDLFYAGIGVNILYEGSGIDTFAGNAGTDHIVGGSGRSYIYGGSGTETIDTGAGNQYVKAGTGTTVLNETAANLTAGRSDWIDNFKGASAPGQPGTYIDLPKTAQAGTTFQSQNGGTLILAPALGGSGQAGLFVAHTAVATVQAQTFFAL